MIENVLLLWHEVEHRIILPEHVVKGRTLIVEAGNTNDIAQSVSVESTTLGDHDFVGLVDLQFINEVRFWLILLSLPKICR